MTLTNGARKVVKASQTDFTLVTLTGRLFLIKALFDDTLGITKGTLSAFRLAQLAYRIITLGIIDQICYVASHV